MENNIRTKINIKGGILPVGNLEDIVKSIDGLGVKELYFGERQQIYFYSHARTRDLVKNILERKGFAFEIGEDYFPNITSSYAAEDIFSENAWLSEGIYQDILTSISFAPVLKINIADSNQGLTPLFSGDLNFISSNEVNFWYLYVKLPSTKGFQCWPWLVYSTEIGRLIKYLENNFSQNEVSLTELATSATKVLKIISSPINSEPLFPAIDFPDYEGLNRLGDRYWLGIYRRNNSFAIEFLKALCEMCLESKVGKICITTWNSLIIKGIPAEMKQRWEKFLGFHSISLKHSSLELNWQLPDYDRSALSLKNFIVNEFHKWDVQTHGIGFTIKTKPMEIAGSIVIERKGRLNVGAFKFFPIYTLLFAKNFNPNYQKWEVFAVDIPKSDLPYYLMLLCRSYYDQLGVTEEKSQSANSEKEVVDIRETVYECQDCSTLYIEKYGDEINKISPGTPFNQLPKEYCCPVCESGVERYREKIIG